MTASTTELWESARQATLENGTIVYVLTKDELDSLRSRMTALEVDQQAISLLASWYEQRPERQVRGSSVALNIRAALGRPFLPDPQS